MTKLEQPLRVDVQGIEVVFSRRTPLEVGIRVLEFLEQAQDSRQVEALELSPVWAPDVFCLPQKA